MPELSSPTAESVSSALAQSWRAQRDRLDAACVAAGRKTADVQLLPVSKAVTVETAAALFDAGAREFGENRAEELERKATHFAELGLAARWHFIGNLQRNKARRVARIAEVVHSVSGHKLLETLARVADEEGRTLEIYLEVHLSGEAEKQGFEPNELPEAVRFASAASSLRLLGLMTMAPRPAPDDTDRTVAREVFQRCATLAAELVADDPQAFAGGRARLSMGMSGDLEQAVAAGSTCVRVGSAIFAGGTA